MKPRILVPIWSFMGTKDPSLSSRIFEELSDLSKKVVLTVIGENITSNKNGNLSLIRIPQTSLPLIQNLFRFFGYSLATIRLRETYDVIFIRTLNLLFLFCGIIAKKFLKKKLVIWLSSSKGGHKGISKKIYRYLAKQALKNANIVGSSSEQVITDTENYLGMKIERKRTIILKPGINLSRFKPTNNHNDKNILLCVARINEIKGLEYLIKTIPYVVKSVPDVKLRIAGQIFDKSYYRNLNRLVSKLKCEKSVEFIGPIPYDQLVNQYNSSKIFILTAIGGEGQSNVTLEAMACEKPVIVTAIGTIKELIEDGKNGFFVNYNKPDIIAQKIISLLKDKQQREKIGKAAKKTIEDKRNWNSFIIGLVKVFNDVLELDKKLKKKKRKEMKNSSKNMDLNYNGLKK